MANDSPKLAGYTFIHPPKPYRVWWEPQYIQHRLSDGGLATINKGFILKGVLEWGEEGWMKQADYSSVAVVFNQATATAWSFPGRLSAIQLGSGF